MTKSIGQNLTVVKAHNLSAVLLRLLRNETVSRVELANELSLTSSTISNLAAQLLEDGIITEVEIEADPTRRRVGRPRQMLKLNPSARYSIGVHIGIGIFRVAITNLRAEIKSIQTTEFDVESSYNEVMASIVKEVNQLIENFSLNQDRIIGVGIGASGLVDRAKGINVLSPRLGWENVPIKSILESHIDLPFCVDNNVRSMALGEAMFGSGRDVNMLAFVYGRIGVGAGFVVNGEVYQGSGTGAGEIGHTVLLPLGGDTCSCGNAGCLETLISERVLLKQALSIADQHPSGLLAQYLSQQDDERTPLKRVFAAARDGDELARQMISDRACYLGMALANLVNIMNPELILLGGMFAEGQDLIFPVAEAKMREFSFASMGENVKIAATKFGWRAGVIGAASLGLKSFFYDPQEGI